MIEPELAFADIFDDMTLAEAPSGRLKRPLAEESLGSHAQDYLKYCVKYAMVHNRADRATANIYSELATRFKVSKDSVSKFNYAVNQNC